MDAVRVWAIARNVFRETIRDRILYLVLAYAMLMGSAALLVPSIANQAERKIILDLGLASMSFFGLIVAIFLGTSLVNKEVEKRTVHVLIAKPMSRSEFILGKHLGLIALISVLLLGMAIIFIGIVAILQPGAPFLAISWAIFFIFLELILIVAAALMFGVFTSSILATLYTIALYIAGHFSRILLQLGQFTESVTLQRIFQAIYLILPDLERLNLKNQAVYDQIPPPLELFTSGLYGVIYTTILLLVAIFVFSRRQF
jgi:ABC-type transport system involved in multi-copper enzyme maturation permease subunit